MSSFFRIEKQPSGELILSENDTLLYRIVDYTVFQDQIPVWEILHRGANLFSGSWQLISLPDRRPAVSYRYLANSYRYGEDLKIVHHQSEAEFLFRRVDPERDHWALMTRAGELVLESVPSSSQAPGTWGLRLVGEMPAAHLRPLICLLTFDRLACGRL